MRKFIRLTLFTGIFIFCIVAFFGISNGLGWEIEPGPGIMGPLALLYIGGLLPLWRSSRSVPEQNEQIQKKKRNKKK